MKNTLIVFALVLLTLQVKSQTLHPESQQNNQQFSRPENRLSESKFAIQAAGKELKMFKRNFYLGTAIQFGGAALFLAGISNRAQNNNSTLFYVGIASFSIGTSITLFSHGHIGKAGDLLLKIN